MDETALRRDVAAAVTEYERLIGGYASYTHRMLDQLGPVEALSKLMADSKDPEGAPYACEGGTARTQLRDRRSQAPAAVPQADRSGGGVAARRGASRPVLIGRRASRLVADEGRLLRRRARARRRVAAFSPTPGGATRTQRLASYSMMEPPPRCPGDSAAPSFVGDEGEA